ncbi:MAG: GldM family protein [Crocinitomicaceae bacterium]|nr:GldM family protein [Crocinitomicaceae bacterium]
MKYLATIAGLMIGVTSLAQNEVAAVELPEHNILYRGFTNKISPAVTNNDGQEVRLIGTNSTVEKVKGEESYIVKIKTREKIETLHVVLYDGANADTVESINYQVANLPAPYVYWGGLRSGGIGNITAKELSIGYPEEVQLENNFEVKSWKIISPDAIIEGDGNNISSAEEFLKKIESGTTLLFTVKVLGEDGITRMKRAQWEVQSWEEESKMNPLKFKRE